MIIFEGEKYACIKCIRGHRASHCAHKDRPLLQVRRGRPNKQNKRVAIIPNQQTGYKIDSPGCITIDPVNHSKKLVDTSGGDVKIIGELPDDLVNGEDIGTEFEQREESSNDNKINGKSGGCPNCSKTGLSKNNLSEKGTMDGIKKRGCSSNTFNGQLKVKTRNINGAENDFVYIPVGNGLYRRISKEEYGMNKQFYDEILESDQHDGGGGSSSSSNNNNINEESAHPPSFIAPMSIEGTELESDQDLYYAASCVLGDCACGDSCACEGCPTHDPKVNKQRQQQRQNSSLVQGSGTGNENDDMSISSIVLPPAIAPDNIGDAFCPVDNPEHVERQKRMLARGEYNDTFELAEQMEVIMQTPVDVYSALGYSHSNNCNTNTK